MPADADVTGGEVDPPRPDPSLPVWSIGSVADRFGIAANTLRSWDRRYGIGPSQRSDGGHRRYDMTDIRRLEVMNRMTGRGVPAATAAKVALGLRPEDLEAALRQPPPSLAAAAPDGDVESIVTASVMLDAASLRTIVHRTLLRDGVAAAWTVILSPALQRIGTGWARGELPIHAEHLASEVMISEMRGHTLRARGPADEPGAPARVVLASADDDLHYLPLLALEGHLADEGVSAMSLGPRVPPASLLAMLDHADTPVFFVWASIERPVDDPLFNVLAQSLRPLHVVIGGPGWAPEIAASYGAVRVSHVRSFTEAASTLIRLAGAEALPEPS